LPIRPRELHPEPLTDPDLNLSIHPARAIDRRLPPSVELRAPPVASWPDSSSMTRPLRSTTITAASSLLRSSPPLSGASVLSALRLAPLGCRDHRPDVSAALTTVAFDQSGPRWLGISDLIAEPEGPTFISYKVARSRLDRLRFVTQDPERTLTVPQLKMRLLV